MNRRLQDIGLVALAVIAAGLIALAFQQVRSSPVTGDTTAGPSSTPTAPDTAPSTLTDLVTGTGDRAGDPALKDAREALASEDPVVVSVLGDSTSNARQEWVQRWARDLAGERPVTISHWDEATQSGFVDPDVLSESGTGSALTVWSGSQSGATAAYSLGFLTTIIPETPDLVLLNYGHNQTMDTATTDFGALLETVRETYGDVPVVVVLQQPQVTDANAQVRELIAEWAQGEGLGTIDVASAFLETGDYAALLQDDIHPNDDGSRLWATTVGAALEG